MRLVLEHLTIAGLTESQTFGLGRWGLMCLLLSLRSGRAFTPPNQDWSIRMDREGGARVEREQPPPQGGDSGWQVKPQKFKVCFLVILQATLDSLRSGCSGHGQIHILALKVASGVTHLTVKCTL